jgi:hypothetical protein
MELRFVPAEVLRFNADEGVVSGVKHRSKTHESIDELFASMPPRDAGRY